MIESIQMPQGPAGRPDAPAAFADPKPDDGALADRARRYHREHARPLRALAYRMLGSRAEAEDIVQDAWLRWARTDERAIDHPGAYLSRMVTNLCLDRLGSAAARREQYVGTWLPEPLLDDEAYAEWSPNPETTAEFAQDVSLAFLLALERLTPLERAAFLLRDVFDVEFDEIARRLGRSEAACRQLCSRARRHVKADYARHEVAREERERLLGAFGEALRTRDVESLARALTEDAVLLSDGGGKATAVPRPLHGGDRIAKVLVAFARLPATQSWRWLPAPINGLPGFLVVDDAAGGRLVQAVLLAPADDAPERIGTVYVQRNPDKLLSLAAARGLPGVTKPPAESS
jgi:RNA polymerase sigma-70 factor (ECF subfamily)